MPYKNPALVPEERAADLVHRMTLEEKASQLVNWARRLRGSECRLTTGGARRCTVSRWTAPPSSRAHRPCSDLRCAGNSRDGFRHRDRGRVKHEQAVRAGLDHFHGLDFWAPNVNIFRDPRWGRGQETYGEDPFLTGRMAVAFVTGMQGSIPATTASSRRLSTSPCTAGQSRRGISPTSMSAGMIWRTLICRPSVRPRGGSRRIGDVRIQRDQWSAGLRQ